MFRSSPFELTGPITDFDSIKIQLASPEKIRSWSHGEVTKPETINYRTFKPERDGLFCARIFGPITDWECLCGKYKRMKHRGVICDKCGVEVTLSKVRRERLGHIELASPCSHVWFFKGLPSRIGHLLDISLRELEAVLYFESYVVVDPGDAPVKEREVIKDENRFRELDQQYRPSGFKAMMGAEAIKELLKRVEITELAIELRERMKTETSLQKKLKYAKRLKVVEAFRRSDNKPQWMILDVIPVIPPELRPLVPLDGGRFATSDLNDLYRRVINRNNRLKKLMDLHAPEVIVRNEKRMLQEAVDALFDNGRRGRVLRGANNRPLKSLSDTLKGKQGRFRQNLLGKRVDYSGRSVIVVGPELKLHQCGLPKKMALELFKPFIYHRLEQTGHCTTIKQAKEMVEQQDPIVWDILEEVIKDHPVLLNRAPTLHRLGIQAFEPVLVEGKAIKIHPLVCTAFNADFDGDQMAVHIPLSPEAQIEASVLMLASHNILSPASGQPITVPTQDLVLGLYYLTKAKVGAQGEGRVFANIEEVLMALEAKQVETLTPIRLRYTGPVLDMTTAYDDQDLTHTEPVEFTRQFINTTVGRAILNDRLPEGMPYVNGLLKKKGIGQLINYLYLNLGLEVTVHALDRIKELGFQYATKSGLSVGLDDMVIPDSKYTVVHEAEKQVIAMQQQYLDGSITNLERSNKVTQMWSGVTERVADDMFNNMKRADKEGAMNPIYIMADSGARGSKQQIRQLSGMRGLMAKPSGEIIETPITANFREGLTVLQYFISTHGARKGLADTALKTADSGYLTRRLVDVAQDVIISELDCGTVEGIYVMPIIEAGETIEPLRDRIIGRVSLERLKDFEGKTIVEINEEIDEDKASAVQAAGIERVKIRSVLTCESKRGCCILCYGRNLGSGKMVEMGEAVGVIAAQSIGEPGTQLTMRTFHIGGTASRVQDASHLEAKNAGKVHFINLVTVRSKDGGLVAFNRNGSIAIIDEKGREKERYAIVYGAKLKVEDGTQVKLGDVIGEWDPYTFSILTEIAGTVQFKDLQEGVTLNEEIDEVTGLSRLVVGDSSDEKRQPAIIIKSAKGNKRYLMPSRAHLMLQDGDEVTPGDILAKIPRETTRTKDITGGLPRVVELFEARKPRDPAIISKIDGVVRFGDVSKGQRKVYVTADNGQEEEYSVPRGVYVNVQEGERLRAGDALIDGPRNPHDILEVLGERELQQYLVNEIQEVYRLQGVSISDKHIETIVRQMLRWVKIEEVGDSNFLLEQQIDRFRFNAENQRVLMEGGRPAIGRPLLLGITKASLSTDSFISAASFQETTRVLTEASINGSVDTLRGLKENVIVGRLIPAGTGMAYYRNVQLSPELEEAAAQVQQEVTAAIEAEERELEQMRMEGEQEELAAE
ncbi:DNA-directed RNA polymerase subunit beta' [Granulicella mallensis]|uniref:DNA-directed RNA polymerase subunit beta' n=2 Tax=Granulicella mallensis TaxID=940614 RepID=G8NSN9_GRAMM|nr:DNA-directed RNA polymerase subunit beta' [Granulicella mallensis]AEU35138.1 DNA-directed RNA polymerase, beta' subunit [Granulicella mallensis MP5ACTX8]MBB5066676.1 DNA-directed RNA polymerase subunit beta' [Granulicella mallensis]